MTATYSDETTTEITDYTLSGTLTVGTTNTVTVTYEGKTATFTVTVTAVPGGGGTGGEFINSGGGTGDANTGDELTEIEDEETALSVMPVQDNPFIDILTDAWYFEDVIYVYTHNLMSGTADTIFNPKMSTTRGMIVTVLGRLAGIDPADYADESFDDVDVDKYYAPYIK